MRFFDSSDRAGVLLWYYLGIPWDYLEIPWVRFNVTPDAFAPPPDPIKRLYQLQYGSFKAMCRGETGRPCVEAGIGDGEWGG